MVRVVDFKSLAPHYNEFESHTGLWILSNEEAIQLTDGMYMVLLVCLLTDINFSAVVVSS